MKFLQPYSDQSYALLRIVSGLMFSFHGFQKILGFMAESPAAFGTQIWIGGVIELAGGLLIMAGFMTRWAAFLASGTMAVAYCQFHWKFQMGEAFFPTINRGEMALLYAFIFLYIACRGGLTWCVDRD